MGFFGGEPLLRTERLFELLDYAKHHARKKSIQLDTFLTTNGTVTDENAWKVLRDERIRIAVSCDGTKAVHDRYRCRRKGGSSFDTTINTIQRLLDIREDLTVASVVCPDTVESLQQGVEELHELGVRKFAPSLDL